MSVTEIGKCQTDFVLSTPTFLDTMFSGDRYVLAQSSLCDFRVYQDFKFFPSFQRNVFHENRFALWTGNTRNEDSDRVEPAEEVPYQLGVRKPSRFI